MNRRLKRNLSSFRLYIKKNILNGRYLIRNLTFAVTFLGVAAVVMGGFIFFGDKGQQPDDAVVAAALEKKSITVIETDNLNPVSVPVLLAQMDDGSITSVQPNDAKLVADISVEYKDKLAAITNDINVRKENNTDSDIIGKLNYGNIGIVISRDGEWIYFSSGAVKGYVKEDYVVTGDAVKDYISPGADYTYATPVYNDDSEGDMKKPERTEENTTTENKTQETTAEETTVEETATENTTVEETTEEAAANDNYITVQPTNRGAITLTEDEIKLMAAIVTLESGSESYEGQLAVANVILNRLEKGYWGNTITSVIYSPGQFDTVNSSYLDYYIENGAASTSIQAVNDALAGNNNIGTFLSFRAMYIVSDPDSFGTHTIIGNHLFY